MTARGRIHDVRVLPWHVAPLTAHMIEKIPPDLSKYLICPMPGLLVALHVGEGDKVEAGQPLATVEAMKMENILRAEKAGAVKTVNAAQGDSLARSEEHTSELQSLMRISYAVFCLKNKIICLTPITVK